MIFSEPLSQYEEILKDAIRTSMKESGAKLAKTFQTLLIKIQTLYMILPRKINFTQMARYGKRLVQQKPIDAVFLLAVEVLTISLLTMLAVASHLCEVYLSG